MTQKPHAVVLAVIDSRGKQGVNSHGPLKHPGRRQHLCAWSDRVWGVVGGRSSMLSGCAVLASTTQPGRDLRGGSNGVSRVLKRIVLMLGSGCGVSREARTGGLIGKVGGGMRIQVTRKLDDQPKKWLRFLGAQHSWSTSASKKLNIRTNSATFSINSSAHATVNNGAEDHCRFLR